MSFNTFRILSFLIFLASVAMTTRPHDAVQWMCVVIGILGALWCLYWLPYRIIEIQEQFGGIRFRRS